MRSQVALCLMALLLPLAVASGQTPQSSVADHSIEDASKMVGEAKGAIVVFHLYASWCPPCRDEIPALIRVCERYKNHPFRMLAFSADRSGAELASFLSTQKVNFEHRRLSTALTQQSLAPLRALGINYQGSIPYTAVFDPSGKLIKQWTGAKTHASYVSILDEAYLSAPPAPAKDPAPAPPVARKSEPAKAAPSSPAVPTKSKPEAASGSLLLASVLVVLAMSMAGIAIAFFVHYRRRKLSYSQ